MGDDGRFSKRHYKGEYLDLRKVTENQKKYQVIPHGRMSEEDKAFLLTMYRKAKAMQDEAWINARIQEMKQVEGGQDD